MTARHTWLLIGAIAGAWDYLKHDDQLTDVMRGWTVTHPVAMRVGLLTLGLHLAGDLPRYLDPISGLGWIASHARA